MVTDISASGRKWPKKHHTCGRNFKHCCAYIVMVHSLQSAYQCELKATLAYIRDESREFTTDDILAREHVKL